MFLFDSMSKFLPGGRIKNENNWNYYIQNFSRAYKSWFSPYLKSRLHPDAFSPLLSFLYTDLNCNLDCHYCFSRGKKIQGMTMKTAKDAVDWLDSINCRVLAYMGGEPLVRKDFIVELTQYAAEKGFFVYLPTNGILLDEQFIDSIGKAGVSAINLAIDALEGYNGIPKNLGRIKSQFEYLIHQEKKYRYLTFLNINITQDNIEDVRKLTEIAHEKGIATDYHINEPPQIEYDDFKHIDDGVWIRENRFRDVDNLIDWLIEKSRDGYPMVNSIEHLKAMKLFIRNELPPWPCKAGILSMVIRLDGTFAPCFELYGSTEDWGNIYDGQKFNMEKLEKQKQKCSPSCLSTCNFQVCHYSQSLIHILQWVAKHAYGSFFGIS